MKSLSDMYVLKKKITKEQPYVEFLLLYSLFLTVITAPQLGKLKVHSVPFTVLTSTLRGVPLSSFKRKSRMRAGTNGARFVLPIMKNNKSRVYMQNKPFLL